MSSFNLPSEIFEIAKMCKSHDYNVWVVGGAVRDYLLGKEVADWDLATDATPDQILKIFKNGNDANIEFGCILLPTAIGNVQITTLREESQYKDSRRPHHVIFTDQIEKDLSRRDFTCNAIAYDILANNWIDPYDGQKDIQSKKIVAVGEPIERLEEDALRILRAVRFQSELGFQIDPSLMQALIKTQSKIQYLSTERIYAEWVRIVCGAHVDDALNTLSKLENSQILPTEWSEMPQISHLPSIFWIRMVGIFIKNLPVFETVSSRAWIDFGIPKKQYKWVQNLIALLSQKQTTDDQMRYQWLRFYLDIEDQKALLEALKYWQVDEIQQYIEGFVNQHPNFDFQDLPLTTEEIVKCSGVSPGPELGNLLESLHIWIANHPQLLSRNHIENWLKDRYTQRV